MFVDLLMPRNLADLVGQDGILRPIGNRPSCSLHSLARRPISNRPQDSILPHKARLSYQVSQVKTGISYA
jgi:hypothetical protein